MSLGESAPAHELTEGSFSRSPVWQFVLEADGGADESHVTPAPGALRLGTYGSFVVQASYRLRNGQQLPGAIQVDVLNQKLVFTPSHLYVGGKCIDPLDHDAETRIARITKQTNARPTHWVLGITLPGEKRPRTGRIARSRFVQALGLLVRMVSLRFQRGLR